MFSLLKLLSVPCLCLAALSNGAVIQTNSDLVSYKATLDLEQWFPHAWDFVELLDIPKLMEIGMKYMSDPEVLNFADFVTSPKFQQLVFEFESMEEFSEAFKFLESKGYNVEELLDNINSLLDLPPYEKPTILRNNKGISGLLQETMAALPIEDMKELFEKKMETIPELAELFETINSEEFVHILKKMSQNPKFKEFKKTFESYGFEFEIICAGAKEILGDYYQGIFCE